MTTIAAIVAIVSGASLITHLLLCWYPESADKPQAVVEQGDLYAVMVELYREGEEQALYYREYGCCEQCIARRTWESARSNGWWVQSLQVELVEERKAAA